MTKNPAAAPALGIKLADIYYVLFRQKWLICGFLAAGLIAGVIVYFAQKTLYWSEAKLLVRYVVDTKSMETGAGAQVQQPSYGGEAIINSELEILTSFDLCEEVAERVGADKILAKKGGSNVTAAAVAIYRGLSVENPRRSSVIKVRFVHPDPLICKAVLLQIIESYFERHKSIHRTASSYFNVFTEQKNELLIQIRKNEEALRKFKEQAGITAGSVDEARKSLSDRLSRLLQELFDAEAQLAEYRSMLGDTNHAPPKKEKDTADIGASPEKVAEYRSVRVLGDSLRNKEFDLLSQFQYTDEHPQVKRVRERIEDNEKRRKALEAEFPNLAGLFVPSPSVSSLPFAETRLDPARATALEWKIEVFSNQLAQVRGDIALLDKMESSILEVQGKLQQDRQSYLHVATGIEAARFDDAIRDVKMSNIQKVQTPSPPALNVTQRLKLVAGTFSGLLIAGVALAFFIELFVDHTVRRSGEFETKIQIPLFLSIPKMGLNGHAKLLPFPASSAPAVSGDSAVELRQTWAADHPLRRYIDGLRDRILTHFEGDLHKPKLIGVTSCSTEVGVTSIAAGLAGALSETGDGNVLLLNLNFEAQAVHPFYRGELTCGLTDALEPDKRGSGMVLQNLYVATAGTSSDPASNSLPKQLARVVPKLRVSDYDYIVFDLPPTTPTTMTARLAGLMDLVILVVESEKDTQEAVKEAGKLLSRSKAHVSAVLNKVRNPAPRWLQKGV